MKMFLWNPVGFVFFFPLRWRKWKTIRLYLEMCSSPAQAKIWEKPENLGFSFSLYCSIFSASSVKTVKLNFHAHSWQHLSIMVLAAGQWSSLQISSRGDFQVYLIWALKRPQKGLFDPSWSIWGSQDWGLETTRYSVTLRDFPCKRAFVVIPFIIRVSAVEVKVTKTVGFFQGSGRQTAYHGAIPKQKKLE